VNTSKIVKELKFKAVRSSGAGGQHVNKVSSKIEVIFDINASEGLTIEEKNRLHQKLSSKLTKTGDLLLQCGDTRSQHRNKELVIKRLLDILTSNLQIPKKRIATKPSKKSVKKRLDDKQKLSLKKTNRRKPLL